MTWGLGISIHLLLSGMVGGAFFAAYLLNNFTGGKYKDLLRSTISVGVVLVILDTILLILDLGKPFRFWHLFFSFGSSHSLIVPGMGAATLRSEWPWLTILPVSPMAVGTWVLTLWVVIGLFLWVFGRMKPLLGLAGFLTKVYFVMAILIISYTGVFLSATNQPIWGGSFILPPLFVVSAVAAGMALLVLISRYKKWELPPIFGRSLLILTLIEVLFLIILLVASPSGVIVAGPLSFSFYVFVVLIGLIVPFVMALRNKNMAERAVLIFAWCVLIREFFLRTVILYGGQM